MVQMQAALSVKKVGNSAKALLASSNSSEMPISEIHRKEACLSPSLNSAGGDDLEEANFDEDSSQFNQKEEPTKLVKLYTSDVDVKPFHSHIKVPELADLRYADKHAAEKHMK